MSADAEQHPDNDGTILGRVIEALDMRWDQFTRKRGTGSDSGVADLGVFFDWCGLEEPPFGKARTPTDIEDFGLWYSHQLVTVWMLPEARDAETRRLTYTNGWSAFEYLLATVFKSTSDLSGYTGAWPQLLDLSEDLDFEHNERIHRPPPAEPLTFAKEHELGDSVFTHEEERKVASGMYQATLFEMLGGANELIFSKLSWGDVETARLALVLPLCSNLLTLRLDNNCIGDKGIVALAESLSSLDPARSAQPQRQPDRRSRRVAPRGRPHRRRAAGLAQDARPRRQPPRRQGRAQPGRRRLGWCNPELQDDWAQGQPRQRDGAQGGDQGAQEGQVGRPIQVERPA